MAGSFRDHDERTSLDGKPDAAHGPGLCAGRELGLGRAPDRRAQRAQVFPFDLLKLGVHVADDAGELAVFVGKRLGEEFDVGEGGGVATGVFIEADHSYFFWLMVRDKLKR